MNDTALKNFATWARTTLMEGVRSRMAYYLVDDGADADAVATVDGTLLSEQQRRQRADLLRVVREGGADALVERAAYTWFNRIAAIRFMELNDRLPSGMRLLSTKDGAFDRRTQAVEKALVIEIEGLDRQKVLEAIQSSDDERLFRVLFLAQCAELSAYMPAVFEPIGSAMELLLPVNLLAQDGLVQHLVEDIPEDDWREGVEIVGWLYQYYNADCKDEFFGSKRKASAADIPFATQLFTPEWIVRYLAENSLGRLWMLNHPDSKLAESMKYYLAPEDGEHEEFRLITSPEEIEVCDPACGSGHILVAAFDLLAIMYEEAGYVRRDVPRLILEKNLTGFEIDPRAAQLASFALSMKACEVDHRFLRRAVAPHIVVLEPVELDEGDIARVPQLAKRKSLLDAMAHLDECGSLFAPEPDDLQAIKEAIASCGDASDLFADATREKLQKMSGLCRELSRTFDAVIANPPYMGSSNMGPWLAKWTAKQYPDTKRDLCTCFIDRGFTLAKPEGYSAMVTMQSWMFLGSFEKMREDLLAKRSIASMAHLGTRAFSAIGGEVVATTATVFENAKSGAKGSYLRLVDFDSEEAKERAIREAIANPDCGWFYRRCADDFKDIPGTPIAYWASDAMLSVFRRSCLMSDYADLKQGLATGNDEEFVRFWWEVASDKAKYDACSVSDALSSGAKWFPLNKGGSYRKWYGNNDVLLAFDQDSYRRLSCQGNHLPSKRYYFRPSLTWSKVSSGVIAFRYKPAGHTFGVAGGGIYADSDAMGYLIGALNSSVICSIAGVMSPTLNYEVGQVASYPVVEDKARENRISRLTNVSVELSKQDWDRSETSWDYSNHPLVHLDERRKMKGVVVGVASDQFEERLRKAISSALNGQDEVVSFREMPDQACELSCLSNRKTCLVFSIAIDNDARLEAFGDLNTAAKKAFLKETGSVSDSAKMEAFSDLDIGLTVLIDLGEKGVFFGKSGFGFRATERLTMSRNQFQIKKMESLSRFDEDNERSDEAASRLAFVVFDL